ncbi:MAG: T9SS type A sorting domain-containing protein [Bacteroidia bacterium]|nr:T9SS type A sorting domain-containing protein [Bacteroidia bacterium]
MKKKLLIASFITIFYCGYSQTPSNCNISASLQTNYDWDVKHLALKSIFTNITSTYRDSIIVPQSVQQPIWEGLAAIYNLTTIPERDSVFNNYCIHQQPSEYLFNSIYIGVDTSYSWTDNWQNMLTTTTGYTALDNLLSTYGFSITHFSTFGSCYATLTTTQNINVQPLCDSIETFTGVNYSEKKPYNGDGNRITYTESGSNKFYNFTIGFGDCPSGCTSTHTFRFKVYNDCSVEYLGILDNITPGDLIPSPVNCYLGSNIIEENKNFNIYPNPSEDFIIVESTHLDDTNYSIVNLYGQTVKSGNLKEETKILIKNLSAGIYLVRFYNKTNNEIGNYKFIKK